MAPLECPDCDLRLKGGRCPKCGWTMPLERPGDPQAIFCVWTEMGRRCQMPGTIGPPGRGRCGWHTLVAQHPRMASEFAEFARWVAMLERTPYCSVWTHESPAALWEAVQGRGSIPPKPFPCRLWSCPHREAENPAEDGKPAEHIGRLRETLAQVGEGAR